MTAEFNKTSARWFVKRRDAKRSGGGPSAQSTVMSASIVVGNYNELWQVPRTCPRSPRGGLSPLIDDVLRIEYGSESTK